MELDFTGYEIRVQGVPATLETELEDGQTVLLVKKIKGNGGPGYISVRVGKLPGRIEEVALNGGRSVEDALAAVELDFTGYEIRVQGVPATLETELEDGQTVLLVKKIKGNAEVVAGSVNCHCQLKLANRV